MGNDCGHGCLEQERPVRGPALVFSIVLTPDGTSTIGEGDLLHVERTSSPRLDLSCAVEVHLMCHVDISRRPPVSQRLQPLGCLGGHGLQGGSAFDVKVAGHDRLAWGLI